MTETNQLKRPLFPEGFEELLNKAVVAHNAILQFINTADNESLMENQDYWQLVSGANNNARAVIDKLADFAREYMLNVTYEANGGTNDL